MKNKHQFALHFPGLSGFDKSELSIIEPALVHRILKILRLQVGEELLLFNQEFFVVGQIKQILAKQIILNELDWHLNHSFSPKIVAAIGLLKKEHLEESLYSCVEMGANEIQPIIFQKSLLQPINQERINKILIAAAEQSKNFSLPKWHEPISLAKFLAQNCKESSNKFIVCDPDGENFLTMQQKISNVSEKIYLIVGPEGGITSEEYKLLDSLGVYHLRLTPSVLRATSALALSLGMLRSFLN